jgi:hypothetical protein
MRETASSAQRRALQEASWDYIASPEGSLPTSFMDVGDLLNVISTHWNLFEPSLLPDQRTWRARMEELRIVRNRLAHCRAPHQDDQPRIEQLLRDLESGARRAIDAYNDLHYPDRSLRDPVVRDWLRQKHEAAHRLIGHGERSYGIRFSLGFSIRPWAKAPAAAEAISGRPGAVWHWSATAGDDRWIDARAYWESEYVRRVAPSIIHVVVESLWAIRVTFPAVDDSVGVSEAIASTFEALFVEARRGVPNSLEAIDRLAVRQWEIANTLDSRVLAQHPLALVEPTMDPLSIFEA